MNWKHLFLSGVAIYFAGMGGGNVGSISTIRAAWHAQTIYFKCVIPNVQKVCGPPQWLGFFVGLALYVGLEWFAGERWLWHSAAGVLVAFGLGFAWAQRRGRRIYPAALRREGIVIEDEDVLPSNMNP